MTEPLPEPSVPEIELATVLAALADPGRLATVRVLAAAGEAYCGQLPKTAGLTLTKSTLSHHLRVLREAGITRTQVEGARRLVSIRHADLEARFPGLLDAILRAADQPTTGQPTTGQPIAGQPIADRPTMDRLTTGRPTTDRLTTGGPAC